MSYRYPLSIRSDPSITQLNVFACFVSKQKCEPPDDRLYPQRNPIFKRKYKYFPCSLPCAQRKETSNRLQMSRRMIQPDMETYTIINMLLVDFKPVKCNCKHQWDVSYSKKHEHMKKSGEGEIRKSQVQPGYQCVDSSSPNRILLVR